MKVHRLISQFSGRLPDPPVAQARDWLGREDVIGIAEVIALAAIAVGLSVTPAEAASLAALPAAPGRRPGLPPELRISDAAAQGPPPFQPGAPADQADRSVVDAVFRDPKIVAIRRSTKTVASDDDDSHRVYLIEAEPGARLWHLAAEAQRALRARDVRAPQVEAYWTGDAPTAYQQAALAASLQLWMRPALPTRGPSLFGAAVDPGRAAQVTQWFQWDEEVWGTMTRLHRLLLRLAADLPVERLTGLRRTLAEGDLAAFAVTLAASLDESGLALAAREIALLREIPRQIEQPELDLARLNRVPVVDAPRPVASFDFGPGGAESASAALLWFMAAQPGVTQVWLTSRSTRTSAVPVFLIAVDPGLAAWHVAFDAQLAQAPAGAAYVEVFWAGEALPDFQAAALESANPVWIATLEESPYTGGIRAASVYDFADGDGVPRFTAGHPRLPDPAECDRLAVRMIAGDAVVPNPALAGDVVDPRRGRIVPQGYHTDGQWIWRASAAYYLAEYQLAPDPELLKHLRLMEQGAGEADEAAR